MALVDEVGIAPSRKILILQRDIDDVDRLICKVWGSTQSGRGHAERGAGVTTGGTGVGGEGVNFTSAHWNLHLKQSCVPYIVI